MTVQPLDAEDREVLRRRAQDRLAEAREWNATANPPLVARMSDRVQIDAGDLLALLDALTRVEAQSETRRLDITYWRERAEAMEQRIRDLTQDVQDERGACLDQMEQVRIRDARIKAVRELHSESRIIPGTPVFGCAECGEPNETEPCATIRALEG